MNDVMKKLKILSICLLIAYNTTAKTYFFIHRSNSTFESKVPLNLKINYLDIKPMYAGEWVLVVFENPKDNFVVNVEYPENTVDDSREPCVFRRKLMNTTQDSLLFLSVGDEFCGMRETPFQRTKDFLDQNSPAISGFTVNNEEVLPIPEDAVNMITKSLVGVDANTGLSFDNINIDSLKLLALEALRLRKKLEDLEKAMAEDQQEYFDIMKATSRLDQSVKPILHMGMEEGALKPNGKMSYNIRATFSYDLISEQGVKAELIHYPPGAYQLNKSAAAIATAYSMKRSIEKYLLEYFEQGGTVKIRIIGSADASPIFSPIIYGGEYKPINKHNYHIVDDYQLIITDRPVIDSTAINDAKGEELIEQVASRPKPISKGVQKSIDLKTQQGFTKNEELAYLRSMGIKDYIIREIRPLKRTRNTFLHQVKLEQSVGGIYRKVVMELLIEDVIRNK